MLDRNNNTFILTCGEGKNKRYWLLDKTDMATFQALFEDNEIFRAVKFSLNKEVKTN